MGGINYDGRRTRDDGRQKRNVVSPLVLATEESERLSSIVYKGVV